MAFESVIGIEVHAQLKTNTKLFCSCSTSFGDKPNANVCPVCLGMPGALPVLNRQAVEMAIMAGLALNCDVKRSSVFSRKNYFYPDLPKGYQISQFDLPICEHGHLEFEADGHKKRVGITRIHMEEDAGKLLHQGADSIKGASHSLVDLNRACTPLIEIVSEPDIRGPKEARAYMETLKTILQHIGVCDGNLEEGSLRADANISIRPEGDTKLGTRTEVKNINSFRSLERAIVSEIDRQTQLVLKSGQVVQETRNYDDATQTTTPLRSKEDAHDYRYFPEPDLPPLILPTKTIDAIKDDMPPLPKEKIEQYKDEFGLSPHECKVLMGDVEMDVFFRACLEKATTIDPKWVAKWVTGDINAFIKEETTTFGETKITPTHVALVLGKIKEGTLSGKMAKALFQSLVKTGHDPIAWIKEKGATQVTDTTELEAIVDKVLADNPDVVEKIKAGKTQSANFLMGQVMKETKGRAKPDLVKELILKRAQ